MSNPPPATLTQAVKQGTDDAKVEAARMFGILAGRGMQLKGLDMMMNPNKDVMSVPDSVKTMGAAGLKGIEGIATAAANMGNDAFKKLLNGVSGGGNHTGAPSHGVNAQGAPAQGQGKTFP